MRTRGEVDVQPRAGGMRTDAVARCAGGLTLISGVLGAGFERI